MKKVLSVVLAAIMIICSFTVAGFAYDRQEMFTSSANFANSNQLESGCEYIIPNGITMTVPSGLTLYLPTESALKVEEGGKLIVNGDLILYGTASLTVDGEIVGGKKVKFDKDASGEAKVQVRYPALADLGLTGKITNLEFFTADSTTADLTDNSTWEKISGSDFNADGSSFYVPLNNCFFVKVTFNESSEFPKYDPALFKVYINGLGLSYNSGYYSTTLSAGGDLDFSDWTNDSDFYRTFKIQLPSGEGYEVEGRDYEVSSDGTVYLKYGTTFAFKVNVDEDYDMSDISVYVYNGYGFLNYPVDETNYDALEMQPDEYGYYIINPVLTDYSVSVVGVVKNSTINLISNIVETIRNIFNMIKEFFEGLDLGSLFN